MLFYFLSIVLVPVSYFLLIYSYIKFYLLKNYYFFILIFLIFLYFILFNNKNKPINKKYLIIGGSSGLGFHLAKYLYFLGNEITITSRSKEKLDKILKLFECSNKSTINGFIFDSTVDQITVKQEFDIIFYCAGISIPGFFKDQNINIFEKQININFIGMIKSLYFFKACSSKPFTFILLSTTLNLFSIPGFSSYSASKGSLKNFYESEKEKLKELKIFLKIIYCCSMKTPGFKQEEITKPLITKNIEHSNNIVNPNKMAEFIIKNLNKRNSLAYDWFTYLAMIRNECECCIDYILFPVAVIILFIAKITVKAKISKNY